MAADAVAIAVVIDVSVVVGIIDAGTHDVVFVVPSSMLNTCPAVEVLVLVGSENNSAVVAPILDVSDIFIPVTG